jgi:hypothetical protein
MQRRRVANGLFLVVLGLAFGSAPALAGGAKGGTQFAAQWSWNTALGGPEYGGTTTLVTIQNLADPAKGDAPATVSARFYTSACKTGTLFSEGGGAQSVAAGGTALFFPYPVPDSGGAGGCLWIQSDRPIVVSGVITSTSYNPANGFSDSRVFPMAFWPVKWASSP